MTSTRFIQVQAQAHHPFKHTYKPYSNSPSHLPHSSNSPLKAHAETRLNLTITHTPLTSLPLNNALEFANLTTDQHFATASKTPLFQLFDGGASAPWTMITESNIGSHFPSRLHQEVRRFHTQSVDYTISSRPNMHLLGICFRMDYKHPSFTQCSKMNLSLME